MCFVGYIYHSNQYNLRKDLLWQKPRNKNVGVSHELYAQLQRLQQNLEVSFGFKPSFTQVVAYLVNEHEHLDERP